MCDGVVTNTAHEADFASRRGAKKVFPVGVGIHPQAFEQKDGQRFGPGTILEESLLWGLSEGLLPTKVSVRSLRP